MPETLATVENLVVQFPVRMNGKEEMIQPVAGVSFQIAEGEVLALVGESGSGKTTIGRALARILKPTAGRIVVDGADVTSVSGHELKEYRKTTQMIFQDPFGSLNPVKTAERHLRFSVFAQSGLKGSALSRRVDELMEEVGLVPAHSVRRKYPHELSGGQRQRLAIARALAVRPKLIVADEPISMLDVSIRASILKLMRGLRDELNLAYLYITHDLASARYFGDRIMVLYGGRVMELAESSEMIEEPLHPYTHLLLAATPGSEVVGKLPETSSEPPNLFVGQKGCPFAPRCPRAGQDCYDVDPVLRNVRRNHWVACHRVAEQQIEKIDHAD